MSVKLSERLFDLANRMDWDGEYQPVRYANSLRKLATEVEALERRLSEADALCIKLAHQKGGQVDEMRDLKARLAEALKPIAEILDIAIQIQGLADELEDEAKHTIIERKATDIATQVHYLKETLYGRRGG